MKLGVTVPAHDAPDADFALKGDELALALGWAYSIIETIGGQTVENAIRALRLIAVNVPAQRHHAVATLARIEGLVDRAMEHEEGATL